MSEQIQPENNRTFKTGPGNWAGDLAWHGDVFMGHQGYISIELDPTTPEKTISLNYPSIKPIPNKDNSLSFYLVQMVATGNAIFIHAEITDGTYVLVLYDGEFWAWPDWAQFGGTQTLPPDWNTENTTLSITVSLVVDFPETVAFDDFSLEAIAPKPQYLPIMGIG